MEQNDRRSLIRRSLADLERPREEKNDSGPRCRPGFNGL